MSQQVAVNLGEIPDFDNAGAMRAGASSIAAAGLGVQTAGDTFDSSWQSLGAHYHAPETAELLAATRPAVTDGAAVASGAKKAATTLTHYADQIDAFVQRKAAVAARVSALETRITCMNCTDAATGAQKDWRQVDPTAAAEETACQNEVAAITEQYLAAQVACAMALAGLFDGVQAHAGLHVPDVDNTTAPPPPAPPAPPAGGWGDPQPHHGGFLGGLRDHITHAVSGAVNDVKDATHQVLEAGRGAYDEAKQTVNGVMDMTGLHGAEAFKKNWAGVGSLVMTGYRAVAGTAEEKARAREMLKTMGKEVIHLEEWKKNPARAFGMTFFDVVTTVTTGGAGAAAKGTITAATEAGRLGRITAVASRAGELASAAKKLATASKVAKVAEATRLTKGAEALGALATRMGVPKRVSQLAHSNLVKRANTVREAIPHPIRSVNQRFASATERLANSATRRVLGHTDQAATVATHAGAPAAAAAAATHVARDAKRASEHEAEAATRAAQTQRAGHAAESTPQGPRGENVSSANTKTGTSAKSHAGTQEHGSSAKGAGTTRAEAPSAKSGSTESSNKARNEATQARGTVGSTHQEETSKARPTGTSGGSAEKPVTGRGTSASEHQDSNKSASSTPQARTAPAANAQERAGSRGTGSSTATTRPQGVADEANAQGGRTAGHAETTQKPATSQAHASQTSPAEAEQKAAAKPLAEEKQAAGQPAAERGTAERGAAEQGNASGRTANLADDAHQERKPVQSSATQGATSGADDARRAEAGHGGEAKQAQAGAPEQRETNAARPGEQENTRAAGNTEQQAPAARDEQAPSAGREDTTQHAESKADQAAPGGRAATVGDDADHAAKARPAQEQTPATPEDSVPNARDEQAPGAAGKPNHGTDHAESTTPEQRTRGTNTTEQHPAAENAGSDAARAENAAQAPEARGDHGATSDHGNAPERDTTSAREEATPGQRAEGQTDQSAPSSRPVHAGDEVDNAPKPQHQDQDSPATGQDRTDGDGARSAQDQDVQNTTRDEQHPAQDAQAGEQHPVEAKDHEATAQDPKAQEPHTDEAKAEGRTPEEQAGTAGARPAEGHHPAPEQDRTPQHEDGTRPEQQAPEHRDGQQADHSDQREGQQTDPQHEQHADGTSHDGTHHEGEQQPVDHADGTDTPVHEGDHPSEPVSHDAQAESQVPVDHSQRLVSDEHLDRLHANSEATQAGRSLHSVDDTASRDAAKALNPIENKYVLDAHSDGQHIIVDGHKMTAADVAAFIKKDPNYHGQDVVLMSCKTGGGADSLAANLSKHLDVTVSAPDNLVWSSAHDGTPIVTSSHEHLTDATQLDGRFHDHQPDGTHQVSSLHDTNTVHGADTHPDAYDTHHNTTTGTDTPGHGTPDTSGSGAHPAPQHEYVARNTTTPDTGASQAPVAGGRGHPAFTQSFDHDRGDGKLHHPTDPENSYRDPTTGTLHADTGHEVKTGQYLHDQAWHDYKETHPDHFNDRIDHHAQLGEPTIIHDKIDKLTGPIPEGADPLDRAKWTRDHAAAGLKDALETRDELIDKIRERHPSVDLGRIDFTQKDRLDKTIQDLIKRNRAAGADLLKLRNSGGTVLERRLKLNQHSERWGLAAAEHHAKELEEEILPSKKQRKGSGIFDLVTASKGPDDRPFLHFFEAKGGQQHSGQPHRGRWTTGTAGHHQVHVRHHQARHGCAGLAAQEYPQARRPGRHPLHPGRSQGGRYGDNPRVHHRTLRLEGPDS